MALAGTSERRSHDARRVELLSAAAAHFRRKGYRATTTRELAEALGIKKASLYYHVRRKSDLLSEICLEGLKDMNEKVAAATAAEPDPALRLKAFIRAHLEVALGAPDIYCTLLMEFRSLRSREQAEVAAGRATYRALIEQVIGEAQDAGALRSDIDARYLALALLNMLSWTLFWYRPEGPLGAASLSDVYYELFTAGAHS